MQVEKTVFISYRRTNAMTARAVYQDLAAHGYDVFLDLQSIDAGAFTQSTLNQIGSRAHFVVILTPSALERCSNPQDWLRREIEHALKTKRNIVPLMFEGFDFETVQQYLVGNLALLPKYNAVEIPVAYFEEAMERLRTRFLSKPLDVILHPSTAADAAAAAKAQANEAAQPRVEEKQLTAEQWVERGNKNYNSSDYDSAIGDYNEAIRPNPQDAKAYYNRGLARQAKGDYDGAIADFTRSIELKNPELHLPYTNRGIARKAKGNYDGAMGDFNEAIRLNPQYAKAYAGLGDCYYDRKQWREALKAYEQCLALPAGTENREVVRKRIAELRGKVK
jgi:tetratricopeptide (TPR) repeat protein